MYTTQVRIWCYFKGQIICDLKGDTSLLSLNPNRQKPLAHMVWYRAMEISNKVQPSLGLTIMECSCKEILKNSITD